MVLDPVKGTVFLCLTGLGTVGNSLVFVSYMHMFQSTEQKPIHLILAHLAFTNIIMLFSKGIRRTIGAFNFDNFLDDTSCKVAVYLARVSRGLSICTSSLLTVVQAITISPRHSMCQRLKLKTPQHILSSLLCLWILNSLISMNLLSYVKNVNRVNITQFREDGDFCYFLPESWITRWIFLTLMVLRDAVFQGAMGGASGYMVFLLHKHHQHVLYLQTSKLLYRTPPELRAAQSVLLLMMCFIFFYWADCFISLFFTLTIENYSTVLDVPEFLTIGYAVLSPFILIHRDEHLIKCCHTQ
ncbi:vomeronasal 1 receptor 211 [Mus musculus]|jgi:vomeronasal1 receptor|uniref:Vomeronasal type-1 receptor n=3 Tax=Mus musculus TaxID=10090 RepID=Q8R266_MOUSE|nr:vomeronasal 1 receptor 211 [Mus musculus]AEF00717.1 vomeronasal type 1 receptor H20 [Mus musculus musculus]AEF00723.1 vomeronasal type 1 receptor H20 [Mus musculus domesticus]AAI38183.1 Vomeronasal 1 receptor, H20 [Mus musculus]AAI38184.1 Vomeronasal 1 receptor, H20 [Mus musculus]AAL47949.1 vomeronasal receptor V1RH20 [Mus musculus]|eukprot:NP_599004.1 vomeronasal 1 receptor 211 [Mus musculus]